MTIRPLLLTTAELKRRMRQLPLPVVARVGDDRLYLDMRTFEMQFASAFVEQVAELGIFEECDSTARARERERKPGR